MIATPLDLVVHNGKTPVAEVMETGWHTLAPETREADVVRMFQDHDLISAPVVDARGYFLGRIVVDDIVDAIREQADHAVLSPVGLDEDEDLFAPLLPSAQRRNLWLAVNLGTGFLASWVIGLFEATAGITWLWFGSPSIAMVIGAALVINLLAAALAGILVPLTLQRMNIDPALSGAVVLTTVTDVVGFMAFLGLATMVLG